MHSDNNFQSNQKSSDERLTLLIHPDGSVSLDLAIPADEASKWLGWFVELCEVVTEQPELALDILNLPRARSPEA